MALDDELKKAMEDLKKNPPLNKEDYEKALPWLKEKLGERGLNEFMKRTDLSDNYSEINALLRYLDDLEAQGVKLCDECLIEAVCNFLNRNKAS